MSVKLVALYAAPENPDAFDAHYRDVHLPLVKKIPGLKQVRVSRMKQKFMGSGDVYLIAEMIFENKADFKNAMMSEENKAAGRDIDEFAKDIVTLYSSEDQIDDNIDHGEFYV